MLWGNPRCWPRTFRQKPHHNFKLLQFSVAIDDVVKIGFPTDVSEMQSLLQMRQVGNCKSCPCEPLGSATPLPYWTQGPFGAWWCTMTTMTCWLLRMTTDDSHRGQRWSDVMQGLGVPPFCWWHLSHDVVGMLFSTFSFPRCWVSGLFYTLEGKFSSGSPSEPFPLTSLAPCTPIAWKLLELAKTRALSALGRGEVWE